MTTLQALSFLMMPAAGLIMAAIMLRVVDRDAKREDERTAKGE